MALEVLEVALELLEALRPLVAKLRLTDRDPALQLRKAGNSITMNICEGAGRSGRDRHYHYTVAAGSNREVAGGLRSAVAWGDLTKSEIALAIGLGHRVGAMLWNMTH